MKSHYGPSLIDTPEKVVEFFNEIDAVCKKYNLSISHEDGHGAFLINNYVDGNIEWLEDATLITNNFD